jgi:hypothetical protein
MGKEINKIKESTYCWLCNEHIVWRIDSIDDNRFSGAIDKLYYHQKNDNKCKREVKLKELLENI